ncbi:hypothetical protein [Sphingobium limneticum]
MRGGDLARFLIIGSIADDRLIALGEDRGNVRNIDLRGDSEIPVERLDVHGFSSLPLRSGPLFIVW